VKTSINSYLLIACAVLTARCGPAAEPDTAATARALAPPSPEAARALLGAVHPTGMEMDWDDQRMIPARVRLLGGWRSAASSSDQALAFFDAAGSAWGLSAPREQLRMAATVAGIAGLRTVKLEQYHRGVPVVGGALRVGMRADGAVHVVQGAVERGVAAVDVTPRVARDAARSLALAGRGLDASASEPRLVVLPSWFGGRDTRPPRLAWLLTIEPGNDSVPLTVALAADDGAVLLEAPAALGIEREIWHASPTPYVAFSTLLRTETGPALPVLHPLSAASIAAFDATGAYDAFIRSYDVPGIAPLTPAPDQAVYRSVLDDPRAPQYGGAYFVPDGGGGRPMVGLTDVVMHRDVLFHEWTHALLNLTGGLQGISLYARSLHEGLADVGSCLTSADWTLNGITQPRNLATPSQHMRDFRFDPNATYQNGAIVAHALYLIANDEPQPVVHDVSRFTVRGLGHDKGARLFFHAVTHYLFDEIDFQGFRFAMVTTCDELASVPASTITVNDCGSVQAAFRAVGIGRYTAPSVTVQPRAGDVAGCIDQPGSSFPPRADIDLVFDDVTAGLQARDAIVHTDDFGSYEWQFGLGCTGPGATAASARATAFLNRVDPNRVGFTARPLRYWAEYWDRGRITSNVISYSLSYGGSCTPSCGANSCGTDGCGGWCGECIGVRDCRAGSCQLPLNGAPTSVCGNVTVPTRWTAAMSPILVTCDVVVSSLLTIDPGVTVEFRSAREDLRIVAGGRLMADGDVNAPILFTSDGETVPSSWGGIRIDAAAADVTIRNAEIRHAGATLGDARFPIQVDGRSTPTIERVRLTQNRRNAIGLATGTYAGNVRLNVVGLPYYVEESDIIINAGVQMTIDPGVVIKVQDNGANGSDLAIRGRLVARGTSAQPIVITSYRDDSIGGDANGDGTTAPSAEDWGGIIVYGDATQPPSELDNVVLRYGGERTSGAGFPVLVAGTAPLSLTHASIFGNRRDAIGLMTGAYAANLRLDVVGVPYYVEESDVVVNAGVTMTVGPGVVIKFQNDSVGNGADLDVRGRLVADGTALRPIIFTSHRDDVLGDSNRDGITAPAPQNWGGIILSRDLVLGPSRITNAIIRYAGEMTSGADFPIAVSGTSEPVIENVELVSNRRNALGLAVGAYAANARLNVVGLPYYVESGDITINAGVTLTVDPGVVVKLQNDSVGNASDLLVRGRLLARGTADSPISFVSYRDDSILGDTNENGSTAPLAEDWGGITLFGDGTQPPSELRHVVLGHGGQTTSGSRFPLRVSGTARAQIENLRLSGNRRDAIGLVPGTYTADLRLDVVGVPYYLETDLTVSAGVTMTVDPGVVLKIQDDGATGTDIVVRGRLLAEGTAIAPIVFTSYRDDAIGGDSNADGATAPAPEDWGGLWIFADPSQAPSRIANARLRYGGESTSAAGCALVADGSVVRVERVVFESNDDAVCVNPGGQPDLGGGALGSAGENRFEGHLPGSGNWAVYNDSTLDVFAQNVWWGQTTAAAVDGVIRDRLDVATRGRVIYTGFQNCVVGSPCTDGNPCTRDDACVSGQCVGVAYTCGSPGVCETATGATCDGLGGCTYPPAVGRACDDGDACTAGDVCNASRACAGTVYSCTAPGVCRSAAGATCDGFGGCAYPLAPAGTACGSVASSACSSPDTCTAQGVCAPNDALATTVCRASAGLCDVEERCDGSGGCGADGFAAPGTACRPSAGACDTAETCSGASAGCPADVLLGSATVCRVSVGACDMAERCSGAAAACPADGFVTSGVACRAAAGACDVAEACSGAAAACPADAFLGGAIVCRGASGACDVAETCSGSAAACPADAFLGSTTVCRGASGACDVAETCSGAASACPADGRRPDGTSCLDGVVCNGSETCRAGVCATGAPLSCEDGDLCTAHTCADPGGCSTTPIAGCCNAASDCDDGNACTTDQCSGPGGTCTHAAIAGCCNSDAQCGDGNLCTVDTCSGPGGTCGHSAITGCCTAATDCNDNRVCTQDACDPLTARCTLSPVAGCCATDADCADTNACTTDLCERSTGACSRTPIAGCCTTAADCDDGLACTRDVCPVAGGACTTMPIAGCCATDTDCADGDACTADSCDPATHLCARAPIDGCCNADGDCSDGSACTVDICSGPAGSCGHAPVPGCCGVDSDCDDLDACTADICASGACMYHPLCADAGVADDGGAADASLLDAEVSRDDGGVGDATADVDSGPAGEDAELADDAAPALDASPALDAAVVDDAAVMLDAALVDDAAVALDADHADASGASDAVAAPADAASPARRLEETGCATTPLGSGDLALPLLALGWALAALLRRRRERPAG
jgi:hypothetical protein